MPVISGRPRTRAARRTGGQGLSENTEIDRGKIFSRMLQGWWKDRGQFSRKKIHRDCPVCGYHGIFLSVGRPARWDTR